MVGMWEGQCLGCRAGDGDSERRPRTAWPFWRAEAPLRGARSSLHLGRWKWAAAPWSPPGRAAHHGPEDSHYESGSRSLRRTRAQTELLGDKFPSPTGFDSEWVPSSPSSSNKMEDVVSSCCSHDGRWGYCSPRGRGEGRRASTVLRYPVQPRSRPPPHPRSSPPRPLPSLEPSRDWTGRTLGHRGRISLRAEATAWSPGEDK